MILEMISAFQHKNLLPSYEVINLSGVQQNITLNI